MNCSESVHDLLQKTVTDLYDPPKVFECSDVPVTNEKDMYYEGILHTPELQEKNKDIVVKAIYYEGIPYQGKPTRVFAFLGMPNVPEGTKVPGIVLVHGGGGSAFESWVRLWNARGYAAIAMDNCGCIPIGTYADWARIPDGGAPGWGGMDQLDQPVTDQWTYQAVSSVVLANSLLRSQPQVDVGRIGLTGISWGGYLTCIVSGLDSRFNFAVPVYGCGFLGESSAWLQNFDEMGEEKANRWLTLWDPSVYLPDAKMPIMWITGSNDFAFPMDSLQKSYRLPSGIRTLCITDMGHGHGGEGENPEEIHAFADTYCMNANPLAKIISQGSDGDIAWAEFISENKISSAVLNYTKDTGPWPERKWESISATIENQKVTARIPDEAKVYYFNLTDNRDLIVSTEHETR